ncbi:MAG: flagellar biosynthesis protein FlhB [Planctomycetes bacterium]|nr:flagellar biosynthesis protein FlhB [Planctomycetota bacterium]
MAQEELGQTRTEAPSPRRREEARAEGQVAFSADLTTGVMLLVGLSALALGARAMAGGMLGSVQLGFLNSALPDLGPLEAQDLFAGLFWRGLEIAGVFLGILVVFGVAAPALQVGFHVAPGLLGLNLQRLSPANGWARLFSMGGWVRGLTALLKVAAVGLVVYWVLKGKIDQIPQLNEWRLAGTAGQAWALVIRVGIAVAVALVVLGLADYAYQRWRQEQSLMMTRQEVKEELKREEGDPQIKARIRKLQREAAKKRMFQDVPRATVIVTNPTHLAVALRYDRDVMAAPKVIAKGAGFVAQRIVELGRKHGVPVVARKPLAQALFKAVKVGQEIPATIYYLVAEVLAFVYRMRGMMPSGMAPKM